MDALDLDVWNENLSQLCLEQFALNDIEVTLKDLRNEVTIENTTTDVDEHLENTLLSNLINATFYRRQQYFYKNDLQ